MLVGPLPSPHLAASFRRDGGGGLQRPYYSRVTCGSYPRHRLGHSVALWSRPAGQTNSRRPVSAPKDSALAAKRLKLPARLTPDALLPRTDQGTKTMKLRRVQVQNFRSIVDSGPAEIEDRVTV